MDITPIIELYEYQIHKYEPTDIHNKSPKYNELYKFNDIDDSPDTECKRITIEGSQTNTDNDTNKSTCDPIYNVKGMNVGGMINYKSIYDINNIYGNYKLFLAKDTDTFQLDDNSINIIIENIIKTINNQMNNINNSNFDKKELLNELNNNINNNRERIKSFQNETAIIQNLYVDNNKKIILLGDLHGSFHTFFRILCRLHRYGVINLETFKINNDYIIIFLGDILDRGMYALDILNIIFKFIINNNTQNEIKIIYNRGNHENYDQYHQNFIPEYDKDLHIAANEISNKFNNREKFNEFINKFNFLLCILSSAIIINNTEINKKIWCCHGGFPKSFINQNMNINLAYNLVEMQNDSADIRWSDFGSNNDKYYVPSARGGNIVTYTYNGTISFLKSNKIDFIIRGHQDSYNNSVLFDINGDIIKINDPNNSNINDIIFYNETSKIYENRVKGPIARLIADKKKYIDIFPVLTISTNTDNRRYLNSDSFALLKFNNNNSISDFTRDSLSIINSIRDVLKNKTNKGDILENKLNILKEIYGKYNNDVYKLYLFDDNTDNLRNIKNELLIIYSDLNNSFSYYKNKVNHIFNKIPENIKSINNVNDYFNKLNEHIRIIEEYQIDYNDKLNTQNKNINLNQKEYTKISSDIHNLIDLFIS